MESVRNEWSSFGRKRTSGIGLRSTVKYKPFDGEKACDRTPVLARVVAKTARLCVVELPKGTKESFSWAEMWISKNVR